MFRAILSPILRSTSIYIYDFYSKQLLFPYIGFVFDLCNGQGEGCYEVGVDTLEIT